MPEKQERKLALLDIDRTSYDGFLIFPLAEQQAADAIVSVETVADMNAAVARYQAGALSYEAMGAYVLEAWARGLRGQSVATVFEHTQKYLTGVGNRYYPYVSQVLGLLKDSHNAFFVTAGPQFTAQTTQKIYQAAGSLSTEFGVENDRFSGGIVRNLTPSEQKLAILQPILSTHTLEDSLAIGDSESDIAMLSQVEYAICVHPTANLAAEAQRRGWFVAPTPDDIYTYVYENIVRQT